MKIISRMVFANGKTSKKIGILYEGKDWPSYGDFCKMVVRSSSHMRESRSVRINAILDDGTIMDYKQIEAYLEKVKEQKAQEKEKAIDEAFKKSIRDAFLHIDGPMGAYDAFNLAVYFISKNLSLERNGENLCLNLAGKVISKLHMDNLEYDRYAYEESEGDEDC